MTDCIFCKIIKGEIPCLRIYEDKDVLAFLDIAPVNRGHALVIPKKHYADFTDMPDEAVKQVFVAAKKVADGVMKGVNANGFNLGMNNRKVAGQLVMHAHVHIMPRFEGDGFKLWEGKKYLEGEAKKVMESINKKLK
ncbi:HIT family protein [Candidatus Woesearchaeota archaeon CG10_big_fil_rev_8_21_14_0_10_44_13]|nr:MAG: HIT family protein [Candidatus Woesearchaeota archaeon CG10_big_fil_rev_8_21_14_0_10_44_13]